jgi:hypothetical protein
MWIKPQMGVTRVANDQPGMPKGQSGFPKDPLCTLASAKIDSKFWVRPRRQLRKALEEAADPKKTPDSLESTYRQLVAQSDLNSFDAWRASRWWGRTYYILGLPAAVLAGIAGAVGLATTAGRIPAAIIALVAAALTAAVTFLNMEINRNRNTEFGAEWCRLADDTRLRLLEYYIKREAKRNQDSRLDTKDDWEAALGKLSELHLRKANLLRGEIGPPADHQRHPGADKHDHPASPNSAQHPVSQTHPDSSEHARGG